MAIPPFPCQDLAKLVLGYLIEEQLMTAYDEFLNESPYLDAQKNEYDRVLMNSLRNILAEYRAIKIYVETCKPVALRRRLLQCSNLLEIVKFLVRNTDIKKLEDPSKDRSSFESQEATTSRLGCDACHSLKLDTCVCSKKRRNVSSSRSISHSESVEAGRSLAQATLLSDLPGNQDTDRHIRVPEHQISPAPKQSSATHQQQVANAYPSGIIPSSYDQSSIPLLQIQSETNPTMHKPNVSSNTGAMECSQNIAEFNTVLNQMYNDNSRVSGSHGLVCTENPNTNSRLSIAENFQDFTSGVRGAPSSNINIPDSSTTENVNVPSPFPEKEQKPQNRKSAKTLQKRKCAFRVGNVKHDITEISSEVIDVDAPVMTEPAPTNTEEPKVTILSNERLNLAPPKNATSTPLVQMKTIYLNGTPIYTGNAKPELKSFTRDEIMAMPTIILVPASEPPPSTTDAPPKTVMAQSSNITTSSSDSSTLPPLTIDVGNTSSNVPAPNAEGNLQETSKPGLVKTVDTLKNASVPKDNVLSGTGTTSTPHMLPPQRKSSSTPRRTSHVRVLDFTTPRRILDETIDENPQEGAENPAEVMISKSPNVSFPRGSIVADKTQLSNTVIETDQANNTVVNVSEIDKSAKKNLSIRRKTNWDADLRALAAPSAPANSVPTAPKPRSRSKTVKKTGEKDTVKDGTTVNSTPKPRKKAGEKSNVPGNIKNSKKKVKPEIIQKPIAKVPSPTVSPIGIACTEEKESRNDPEKVQNKSNDEERIDTPEIERLSLRNEIGAKLNISDILETPYKQALYDIQMETPRFLGPELPDDPMSDIKITDIPTPRFLSSNTPFTPKPTQATPSSYSSRPTDYSSGGSYYKPDDQDYLPNLEEMTCPVTSSRSKNIPKTNAQQAATTKDVTENQVKEKSVKKNRSRPVRQCTKNVSYYNSPMNNKNSDAKSKDDASSCSDTLSLNSSLDSTIIATPIIKQAHQTPRTSNRRISSAKKCCSPINKIGQKPFMKIKPRRPTPTKEAVRKNCGKSFESQTSKRGRPRVRQNSRSKGTTQVTPAPMKSRRKSSTPRKLHKTFNSETSSHESPEATTKEINNEIQNSSVSCVQDSDTEHLPLRWSDDGSQDTKLQADTESIDDNDTDDITKIKEYIDKTVPTVSSRKDNEGSLQKDLVERGFDIETAKIIERDLLSTHAPMDYMPSLQSNVDQTKNKTLERSVESDCSTLASNLVINEDDDEEVELSAHDSHEASANYLCIQHDESNDRPPVEDYSKLKDKFTMEICIDEGPAVRLIATAFNYVFSHNPQEDSDSLNDTLSETALAVSSIANMDRLYTPLKDPIRAQCYEIFDSTLTSIDTPLKPESPIRRQDVPDIVLPDADDDTPVKKDDVDNRKRKRSLCSSASEESVNDNKRVKPETQFMLQTKDIKNIDIEVLLSKLHGS